MGKTELILFGTKRKLKKWENYSIECYGQVNKSSPHVNYLGLTLDQYLNGEQMALGIIKKVNSRLKFLFRQAHFLDQKTKKTLSTALVLCLFDYSIASWYGGIPKLLGKTPNGPEQGHQIYFKQGCKSAYPWWWFLQSEYPQYPQSG